MAKKEIISKKLKNFEKTRMSSSYIGKRVLSKSGEYVGRIYDILLKNDSMMGVMVRGKRDVFIGREFFGSESNRAIVLSVEPVINILRKQVFDSAGKKLGKVIDLKRKSNLNSYSELMVKKAVYSRAVAIPKKDVDVAKKNVILKKEYA